MNINPDELAHGNVIDITRELRRKNVSGQERAEYLSTLIEEADKHGLDAKVVMVRKRGRPSNLSKFLSIQRSIDFNGS